MSRSVSRRSGSRPDISPEFIPTVAKQAAAAIAAFNTWSFKREKPSDPARLQHITEIAIRSQSPLSFVLYWGKGPRAYACAPERECLEYLASMAERIQRAYSPGARFDLVFTDTHAELNGHRPHEIAQYFEEVVGVADSRLFQGRLLSEVVDRARPFPDLGVRPDPETLQRLEACAAKWFRGEGSAEDGARRYYRMNMDERRAIELEFSQSIFVTFNGSAYRSLFPDQMPIFYMYSVRKGTAVKPWFMPDPAVPPPSWPGLGAV